MVAAAILAIALQSVPIGKIGDWALHSDTDRMTDKTTLWISTEETPNGNALTYGCGGSRGSMFMFMPTAFVGTVRPGHWATVTFRVDGGPPQTDEWKADDDVIASLGGGTKKLKLAISGGKTLLFRGEDYRGANLDAEFKVDGAAEAIARVDASCNS